MSITLSHQSALHAVRQLRAEGVDLRHEVDHTTLARPSTWVGKRWSSREFIDDRWHWPRPTKERPLHVLVPSAGQRVRMAHVVSHQSSVDLPATSFIWLNDVARMSSPTLLFAQMATVLPLADLVLLGYELCGGFTRSAEDPLGGPVIDGLPPATSVEELADYLRVAKGVKGARRAREALAYVADGAISAPEAVLATMYSLPTAECGYGMGPVRLNKEHSVPLASNPSVSHGRYPDLMLGFAPMGINYDGEKHLDLSSFEGVVRRATLADGEDREEERSAIRTKRGEIRAKYVDDLRRNREFLAHGAVVLPMTKEDLYGWGNLDNFTRLLLMCAKNLYGVNTSEFEDQLDDAHLSKERYTLLNSLLPSESLGASS